MIGVTNAIVRLKGKSYKFATASWEEISQVSQSGKARDYFNIGDRKVAADSNDDEITVDVVGFENFSMICVVRHLTPYYTRDTFPTPQELWETLPSDLQPFTQLNAVSGESAGTFYLDAEEFVNYFDHVDLLEGTYLLRDGTVLDCTGSHPDVRELVWLGDHSESLEIVFGFYI